MIRFNCPFCNCLLSAPEECAGRVSRCKCGNAIIVPQALGNPPGPPGEAPQTAAGPAGSFTPPDPGPTPATPPRRRSPVWAWVLLAFCAGLSATLLGYAIYRFNALRHEEEVLAKAKSLVAAEKAFNDDLLTRAEKARAVADSKLALADKELAEARTREENALNGPAKM